MTRICYSNTARLDLAAAILIIQEYFKDKKSISLGKSHVSTFKKEMRKHEKLLQDNPKLYAVRKDGHFKNSLREYRSFSVHWFIVFYSYDEYKDEVVILFIRSSKSDYSNVLYLDQSRLEE